VQGYGIEELARMPQIISGTTPEAAEEAAALFRNIVPEIVSLNPIEAEFAKLFGNAYRYIEFASPISSISSPSRRGSTTSAFCRR